VLARSGKREAAVEILQQLLDKAKNKYVSPYDFAVIYAGLNDNDRAMEWLNKAFEEHAGFLVYVYLDPRLKTLRSDARFQHLLRRMGFVNQRA
jgi:tetratricopeptide (TPR) repeat protein